jgi:hypothetical protein
MNSVKPSDTPRRDGLGLDLPNGTLTLATVRDPDGLPVLLTPGSITRSA